MAGSLIVVGEVPPELFEKVVKVEWLRDDDYGAAQQCNRILTCANAVNYAAPVGLFIRK